MGRKHSALLVIGAALPGLLVFHSFLTPQRTSPEQGLEFPAPGYQLLVSRQPVVFSIRRADKEILRFSPSVERGGTRSRSFVLRRWENSGGNLIFTLAGEDANTDLALKLRAGDQGVEASAQSVDGSRFDVLELEFSLEAGGHWYGGNITSSHNWPLETGSLVLDPFLATSNQASPFWLNSSGSGVLVGGYEPFGVTLNEKNNGLLVLRRKNADSLALQLFVGKDIVEVFRKFISQVGKPAVVPPKEYLTKPVFNTWIEFMTKVSQQDLLAYAGKIRDSGFPYRVIVLDDGWATHYGDNEFEPGKFPDPGAMVRELHSMGFQVALWTVPFVEPAAENFNYAAERGYLVRDRTTGRPALVRWWNGEAGLVDLSNPSAFRWFRSGLESLQRRFEIDGFKLDAGDAEYFDPSFVTSGNITPNRYADLFAGMGRFFDINELRVSWLSQEVGLVQRLRDKNSNWSLESGLGSLVPHGLTESLIGYPYFCPDIIGGGLDTDFLDPSFAGMDPELFVRWAEASSLMPMMQFSYAPWRLDSGYAAICRRYAELHVALGDYIYQLAVKASEDGTPIVRPLFFRNPEDEATYRIRDQFLLGDRFLVAPVLVRGAVSRDVYLPAGLWKDFWSGDIFRGGRVLDDVPAPLDKLPVFVSID